MVSRREPELCKPFGHFIYESAHVILNLRRTRINLPAAYLLLAFFFGKIPCDRSSPAFACFLARDLRLSSRFSSSDIWLRFLWGFFSPSGGPTLGLSSLLFGSSWPCFLSESPSSPVGFWFSPGLGWFVEPEFGSLLPASGFSVASSNSKSPSPSSS